MRKVVVLYTKEKELRLLNQSLSQIVLGAVENTIKHHGEEVHKSCIDIVKSIVPEATDVTVNPIRFMVKTLDGKITVTFKDGSFVEV